MAWGGERLRYVGGGTKDEHHFVFNCHPFEILPRSGVIEIYNLSNVAPAYFEWPFRCKTPQDFVHFQVFCPEYILGWSPLAISQ